jgi:hypothetical protein
MSELCHGHETNRSESYISPENHPAFPRPKPSLFWQIPTFCEPSQYLDPKRSKSLCMALHDPVDFLGEFWDSEEVLEWASAEKSSILLVQGDYQTTETVEQISLDLVLYLEDCSHPVVWIFNDVASGKYLTTAEGILKQLAIQILKMNSRLHSATYLSFIVEHFRMASKDTDWFDVIHFVLEGMTTLCMVIDLGILGARFETASSWIEQFSDLFERLRVENSSILKIALLSCWPLPHSDTQSLTVDIHAKIGPPSLQRANRGLETSGLRSLPFAMKSMEYDPRASQSADTVCPQETIFFARS